jgi:hypothetical protein
VKLPAGIDLAHIRPRLLGSLRPGYDRRRSAADLGAGHAAPTPAAAPQTEPPPA